MFVILKRGLLTEALTLMGAYKTLVEAYDDLYERTVKGKSLGRDYTYEIEDEYIMGYPDVIVFKENGEDELWFVTHVRKTPFPIEGRELSNIKKQLIRSGLTDGEMRKVITTFRIQWKYELAMKIVLKGKAYMLSKPEGNDYTLHLGKM